MTEIRISIQTKQTEIPPTEPTTRVTLGTEVYMLKEDREVFGGIRSCAACPAVMVLKNDSHVFLTEQWQYYLVAINYNMPPEDVMGNLWYKTAYTNGTGFGDSNDPRANWVSRQRLDAKSPQFDKVRSNVRCVISGVEIYNVVQAMKDVQSVLQGFLWSKKGTLQMARQALISQNMLKVKTFDASKLPPLKEGKSYPQSVSQISPDDYLYLPQFNREMFLVANIVKPNGDVVQFDKGGLYNWTQDNTPYTFLPHISHPAYGDVLYPLNYLTKLGLDAPVPSPYRRMV